MQTPSPIRSLHTILSSLTADQFLTITAAVIQALSGTSRHTNNLSRYNFTKWSMLEDQPKVNMNRVSFLERRTSKSARKKVIPLTGQEHVYMLAPGRYGIVLFLLGGTPSCGDRWYAILKESKLNTLLAILLVDVAPVDSVDFPRRTHYFCKQGPEMDEALNSATELDVRELFKQPQFGELQHSFEAHSAFPTPTSSHPEDKRVGKTRTTRSSPLPGFTTPVAPAGKSHNDRSGYNIDSLSSDSATLSSILPSPISAPTAPVTRMD